MSSNEVLRGPERNSPNMIPSFGSLTTLYGVAWLLKIRVVLPECCEARTMHQSSSSIQSRVGDAIAVKKEGKLILNYFGLLLVWIIFEQQTVGLICQRISLRFSKICQLFVAKRRKTDKWPRMISGTNINIYRICKRIWIQMSKFPIPILKKQKSADLFKAFGSWRGRVFQCVVQPGQQTRCPGVVPVPLPPPPPQCGWSNTSFKPGTVVGEEPVTTPSLICMLLKLPWRSTLFHRGTLWQPLQLTLDGFDGSLGTHQNGVSIILGYPPADKFVFLVFMISY